MNSQVMKSLDVEQINLEFLEEKYNSLPIEKTDPSKINRKVSIEKNKNSKDKKTVCCACCSIF